MSLEHQQLQERYKQVQQQIQVICQHNQAQQSVQLLAVSKTQPSQAIQTMYQFGQRCFGENYLQEALDKIQQLADLDIEWHFIGHIQRNKTKPLAENFAWVHGVERLLIAERLSQQRPEHLAPLNICLQVNIDNQDSKSGCAVAEVPDLVASISQLAHIRLRGLMIIPQPNNMQAFSDAQQLFNQVKQYHHHPEDWDTLSMGMSADLEYAIPAGSTMVRVGTALFGERDYSTQ